jgi:hypothetical protein
MCISHDTACAGISKLPYAHLSGRGPSLCKRQYGIGMQNTIAVIWPIVSCGCKWLGLETAQTERLNELTNGVSYYGMLSTRIHD